MNLYSLDSVEKSEFLTGMHSHVFFQRVVVVASFLADSTHKVGHLCMSGHVRSQSGFSAKSFIANLAVEGPFSCMGDKMGLQVIFVGK